jgi:hypothetical protein
MPHTKPQNVIEEPLCAKEAARLLGYSYRGLLRAMAAHKIKLRAWRNVEGGRMHFDRLEVLLHIERRKAEGLKQAKKPPDQAGLGIRLIH